jgi:hypothetical protein
MNRSPRRVTRRDFLHTTVPTTAAAVAFPTLIPASALGLSGTIAPSNRISLGIIGTGNQGFNDINSFLADDRVQIVAVCDVNRESAGYWEGKVGGREPARRLIAARYGKNLPSGTYRGCDAIHDYRSLLDRADIDAVEICTPDHWHAMMALDACKAKKDIYCQKPLSLTVAEGRAMSYAGSEVQGRLPNRPPAAVGSPVSPRSRTGPQRADRRAANGPCRPAGRPHRLCQDRQPQEARAGSEGL